MNREGDAENDADAEDESCRAGLCANCRWAKVTVTPRGSRFYLCTRSKTDSRFPKFPALPVIRCGGFEEKGAESCG